MKRGQVTVFIIIGLIVLTAVILTIYVNKEYIKGIFEQQTSKLTGVPQNIQPVEDYIKFCLEDTSKISTQMVLMQGGYFEPNPSVAMGSFNVGFWFDKKDITPSLDTIGKEIAKSMSYLLPGCIMNFDENYTINIKEIKPSVKIAQDKLIVSANTVIDVEYKNLTYNLNKNYATTVSSEAKNLYDSSVQIVKAIEGDPETIHMTLLASIGYDVNFFKLENSIVYALTGDELTLMFANKL